MYGVAAKRRGRARTYILCLLSSGTSLVRGGERGAKHVDSRGRAVIYTGAALAERRGRETLFVDLCPRQAVYQ